MSSKPIIPWMGGKRKLAKKILPEFPDHQCYVEPFCGGAALFFMKEPSPAEVINDFNGDIVNLYRVLQHHLEEFVKQFRWSLVSRQMFEWLKLTPEETLTDIQRAARFYYLQKNCFGGAATSKSYGTATTRPVKLNLLRIEEELSEAHLRLARVNVENLDWLKCAEKYDRSHTLHYMDPPYWETKGYGNNFDFSEYERMADFCKKAKGKVIISINDHPAIREVFSELRIMELSINYTSGKGHSPAKELVFFNW